jgi:hypothetical protein
MRDKACLFSDPEGTRFYLRNIGSSIQQECENDRFLLTLPCVVDLMLESPEGRQWILHEYEKIINDPKHRSKTEHVDGRDEFFDIFYDELNLDLISNTEVLETPCLPAEFKTDEWWKKRGL